MKFTESQSASRIGLLADSMEW